MNMNRKNRLNRCILNVSVKYFLSIILIGLIVVLTGCGKGSTNPGPDENVNVGIDNKDKKQPIAISAQVSTDTFIIDLNNSSSVNIDISTTFDDDSTTTETYTLDWIAATEKLQLSDSENELIPVNYDLDTLKNATSATITITDKIFPENLSLTVSLVLETVSELSVTYSSVDLEIGESAIFLLSAKLSSGTIINDATSIATCFDDSIDKSVIEVLENCSVKRLKNGDAEVSAILNRTQTQAPIVNKFSFSAKMPVFEPTIIELQVIYRGSNLILGDEAQLTLSATWNDNTRVEDVLSIARCIDVSTDKTIIAIIDGCRIQGLKEGRAIVSAELINAQTNQPEVVNLEIDITLPPPEIDKIDLLVNNASSVNLFSGDVIDVQVIATWDVGTPTIETMGVSCVYQPDDGYVFINGCQITVSKPGTYTINLISEFNIQGITNNTVFNPLQLVVSSRIVSETVLGSGEYDINIPSGVSDLYVELENINQGTYKTKIVFDNNLTEGEMVAVAAGSGQFCANAVFPTANSIACGVTLSNTGSVYVTLEGFSIDGVSGKLKLTLDPDILNNDNKGVFSPVSINDYTLLTLGADLNGHVSANAVGANISRYYINETNGLPSATSYNITIVFDPDSDDSNKFNFDINSVNVGWTFNGSTGEPARSCTFSGQALCLRQVTPNSLVYTILDSQTEIFVTVYGNGSNALAVSPATADGELSYRIRIDSNPM